MKIKELYLQAFGQFNNKSISLKDGFNIIVGENESGKSTVQKFIEGILFGFYKENVHRKITTSDYDKYRPLEQESFCGAMVVEKDGKEFRLERNFLKGQESFTVRNNTTGEDVSDQMFYDRRLKQHRFFDPKRIHREVFENSVSISQLKSRVDQSLTDVLKEYVSNYMHSGGEISVAKAVEDLQRQKDVLGTEKRQNTPLYEVVQKLQALQEEYEQARKSEFTIAELARKKKNLMESLQVEQSIKESNEKKLENLEVQKIHKKYQSYRSHLQEVVELEKALQAYKGKKEVSEEAIQKGLILEIDKHKHQEEKEAAEVFIEKLEEEMERIKDEIGYEEQRRHLHSIYSDYEIASQIGIELENQQSLLTRLSDRNKKTRNLSFATQFFGILLAGLGVVRLTVMDTIAFTAFIVSGVLFIGLGYWYRRKNQKSTQTTFKKEQDKVQQLEEKNKEILEKHQVNHSKDLLKKAEEIKEQEQKNHSERERLAILENRREYTKERMEEIDEELKEIERQRQDIFTFFEVESMEDLKEIRKVQQEQEDVKREIMKRTELMDTIMPYEDFQNLDQFFKGKHSSYEGTKTNPDNVRETIEYADENMKKIQQQMDRINGEIKALEKGRRSLGEIVEEADYHRIERDKILKKKASLAKAMDTIGRVSEKLHHEIAPELNQLTAKWFYKITGKDHLMKITNNIEITLEDQKRQMLFSTDQLSGGTLDQLYFSFRLAIAEFLEMENLPLILDEPFTQYDAKRFREVMDLLLEKSKEQQILYFTSKDQEQTDEMHLIKL